MAKLDFFVRYPDFFNAARTAAIGEPIGGQDIATIDNNSEAVESAMVRHHYGPWDKRYYHVLAHLEARGLMQVSKRNKAYILELTKSGRERASTIAKRPSFTALVARMKEVRSAFGSRNGSSLKRLVYAVFNEEVGRRKLGEVIR